MSGQNSPWKFDSENGVIIDRFGGIVVYCSAARDPADFERIVEAVNTRDALINALKLALAALEAQLEAEDPQACTQMEWETEPLPTIRAALGVAEGAKNDP